MASSTPALRGYQLMWRLTMPLDPACNEASANKAPAFQMAADSAVADAVACTPDVGGCCSDGRVPETEASYPADGQLYTRFEGLTADVAAGV
jgi:hypothetical protein